MKCNKFLAIALLTTILICKNHVFAQNYDQIVENVNSTTENINSRALLSKSDEYVMQNQKRCAETRSFVSCIKYKASKIVWKIATNNFGLFPNEYSRDLRTSTRRIGIIQMAEPSDIVIFKDDESRSLTGDSEIFRLIKFLKRAVETFGRNHAVQIALNSDSGARISSGEVGEARLTHKKRRKWLIILPLIILMKIAHLKMTLVTLLLGTLGLNVLLVGGIGWLIHYLKFKTLCKIHPHLVQSHSHVYDSDPAEYSQFVGSSYPGPYYNGISSDPHEVSVGGYGKDWGAGRKTFNSYNYLDTISKRLQ